MRRFFKRLFALVTGTILVIILVATTLFTLIDPNDYKPQIIEWLAQQTGRTLKIDGEIQFTIFPKLGLEVKHVQLSNAIGFVAPTFASVKQAKIFVELLPLFQKRLVIDSVLLTGGTLTLARNTKGQGNWENLVGHSATTASNETPNFSLNQLNIQDATFTWDDRTSNSFYQVTQLQLQAFAIDLTSPFPVAINFHLANQNTPLGHFLITTQVQIDALHQRYTLTALKIEGQIQNAKMDTQKVTFASTLIIDLMQEILTFEPFTLAVLDGEITAEGQLHVNSLLDKPVVSGALLIRPFNLSNTLKNLGLSKIPAQFPKIMTLNTLFKLTGEDLTFEQCDLHADGNRLEIPQLVFNIAEQSLIANTFATQLGGISVSGQFTLNNIFSHPQGQGYIKVAQFNPRHLFQRLGQPIPKLSEKTALTAMRLETHWQGDASHFEIQDFTLQLDATQGYGYFSINNFAQPEISLNMALDTFNVDDYLPTNHQESVVTQPLTLPVTLLRQLRFDGKLTIKQLNVMDILLSQCQLVVSAKAGQLQLKPMLTLHQGQVTGDILLDVRTEKPHLQVKQSIHRLPLAPLLEDFSDNPITSIVDITNQLTATLNLEKQRVQIAPLQLTVDFLPSRLLNTKQTIHLKVPTLQIDLLSQSFSGQVIIDPFNLRTLLKRIGQVSLTSTDTKTLAIISLTTQFQGTPTTLIFDKLKLRLDETQLQGYVNLQQPFVAVFDLTVDTLDLDRYLPRHKKVSKTREHQGFSVETLEFLKSLSLNGILKIAQLKVAQLNISRAKFLISSKKAGQITINPL